MASAGAGSDVEELIKRVSTHSGVRGYLIVNSEGIPIRHSFSEASYKLAVQYAALFQTLSISAKNAVHAMDSSNDVQFIRLRSHKDEIIVVPDVKYILIVVQEPQS